MYNICIYYKHIVNIELVNEIAKQTIKHYEISLVKVRMNIKGSVDAMGRLNTILLILYTSLLHV
jgi:hypothetical protein